MSLFDILIGPVQLFNREEKWKANKRSAKVCHDRLEIATTGIGDEGLGGKLETFDSRGSDGVVNNVTETGPHIAQVQCCHLLLCSLRDLNIEDTRFLSG